MQLNIKSDDMFKQQRPIIRKTEYSIMLDYTITNKGLRTINAACWSQYKFIGTASTKLCMIIVVSYLCFQ